MAVVVVVVAVVVIVVAAVVVAAVLVVLMHLVAAHSVLAMRIADTVKERPSDDSRMREEDQTHCHWMR